MYKVLITRCIFEINPYVTMRGMRHAAVKDELTKPDFGLSKTKESYPLWLAHASALIVFRIHYCRSSVRHQNNFYAKPSQFE